MTVLVIAPNWLGDAVMALPAVADVRRHFRQSRLIVAGRPGVAPLFELAPGVDDVLVLPGRAGRRRLDWGEEIERLAATRADVAVLFPNAFSAAWMLRRARVPERWGTATDLRRWLLTRAVRRPDGRLHQAAYYQALVAALGMANGPCFAQLVPPAGPVAGQPPSPYVVVAPGAAYGTAKQWPADRFGALAGALAARGWPVAIAGSHADLPVCDAVGRAAVASGAAPAAIVNLAGQTTLAQLAALLGGAAAVVSNDSGAMHLAGAVGAPVVGVFGATNEHRTAPLAGGPGQPPPAIVTADAFCRPCLLRECPIDHRCMTRISVAMVAEAVVRVARG